MKHRTLGEQGQEVSVLGFGTWPIGGTHVKGDYGAVDDREAKAAIGDALNAGVTLFDTAPTYGNGRAEELLGAVVGPVRDQIVLCTKCGAYWDEARGWIADSSESAVRSRLARSLSRLSTDYADVLFVHVPDRTRPAAEVTGVLDDLVAEGLIRAYGVSNFRVDDVVEYAKVGNLAAVQVSYHMFDRRLERRMFPLCEELGVGVMAFGSLAHGLLTGTMTANTSFATEDWRAKGKAFGLEIFSRENLPRNVEVVDRLARFARDRGRTVAQLALAWVLRLSVVNAALVGIRRPSELRDNLGSLELQLSDEELADIDVILADAAGTSEFAPEYTLE